MLGQGWCEVGVLLSEQRLGYVDLRCQGGRSVVRAGCANSGRCQSQGWELSDRRVQGIGAKDATWVIEG